MDWLASKLTHTIPKNKIGVYSDDSLLFNTFPYYLLFLISLVGMQISNPYVVLFIMYAFLPLLDEFFSLDGRNPNASQVKQLEKEGWKYDLPLYVTVIYDWWIFFYGLRVYQSFEYSVPALIQLIGIVIIISNLNAAQFAVAHQLMHKPGFKRFVGTWHMLKTLNIHFTYEHLFGHHRKVATQEDPASASKGMNVYRFFIRSYFCAYKSVYNMEKEKEVPLWRNHILVSIFSSIVFCSLIFYFYSFQALAIFLVQVLGAVFYLQVINYIEHYGLRRKKLFDGSYEKVTPRHSWNSPHRFSNYLFFKLQRHSDHHQNGMKPYQTLLTIDEAPQLPHGYIVMTVMALFPSEFMRIMDPLVDQYNRTSRNGPQMEQMYKYSVEQTRKFVMKITITAFTLATLTAMM